MRRLIWHYMLCANVRRIPILCVIPILIGIALWPRGEHLGDGIVDATMLKVEYLVVFMSAMGMGLLATAGAWPVTEFRLSLPANRRTLFAAQTTACLMMIGVFTVPLILVAAVSTTIRGVYPGTWAFGTNITAVAMATILIAVPLDRLLRDRSWVLQLVVSLVALAPGFGALILLLMSDAAGLIPSAFAVLVGGVAWYLGMRQFDHMEVAAGASGSTVPPSSDAPGAMRATPLDALPAFFRVMARSVWLTWWYPLLLIYAFLAGALGTQRVLAWMFLYPVIFLPMVLGAVMMRLSPHVRRERVFRSIMAPVTAALLTGALFAPGTFSVSGAAVGGLLVVLGWMLSAWVIIPSVSEYRMPAFFSLRFGFVMLLSAVVFLPLIPIPDHVLAPVKATVARISLPPILLEPSFQIPALLLAGGFLWWLAERKFRHYEPPASALKAMAGV